MKNNQFIEELIEELKLELLDENAAFATNGGMEVKNVATILLTFIAGAFVMHLIEDFYKQNSVSANVIPETFSRGTQTHVSYLSLVPKEVQTIAPSSQLVSSGPQTHASYLPLASKDVQAIAPSSQLVSSSTQTHASYLQLIPKEVQTIAPSPKLVSNGCQTQEAYLPLASRDFQPDLSRPQLISRETQTNVVPFSKGILAPPSALDERGTNRKLSPAIRACLFPKEGKDAETQTPPWVLNEDKKIKPVIPPFNSQYVGYVKVVNGQMVNYPGSEGSWFPPIKCLNFQVANERGGYQTHTLHGVKPEEKMYIYVNVTVNGQEPPTPFNGGSFTLQMIDGSLVTYFREVV